MILCLINYLQGSENKYRGDLSGVRDQGSGIRKTLVGVRGFSSPKIRRWGTQLCGSDLGHPPTQAISMWSCNGWRFAMAARRGSTVPLRHTAFTYLRNKILIFLKVKVKERSKQEYALADQMKSLKADQGRGCKPSFIPNGTALSADTGYRGRRCTRPCVEGWKPGCPGGAGRLWQKPD
jgi:hypothetical protein